MNFKNIKLLLLCSILLSLGLFHNNVQAFNNAETNSSSSVTLSSISTDKTLPQYEGTSIDVTANATGGSSLLYRFWIFDGASWKVVQDYSSSSIYNWTPSTSGSYRIWVDVKDANSNKDVDSYKEILYTIKSSNPVTLSSITTDKTTPQFEGTSIKVTANATGGDSMYYRFWIFDGASWKVVQDYSSSSIYNWTPSTSGSYRIWVDVKDANSNKDVDSYKEILYTIKSSNPVTLSSVITNKTSPQFEESSIKVTANATGGSSLVYRFWICDGVSWKVVQDYSAFSTYNWTPSIAGSYRIWVDVKDVNSNKDVDSYKEILYTIESSKPVNLSSVITDKTSPQYEGHSIKVTANATGGSSLLYRFWVCDGGSWKVVQDYSVSHTYQWTPSAAGAYRIWVDVKDANSNKDVDAYKEILYAIKPAKHAVLSSIITDKTSPQFRDTSIKVTANATGGDSLLYRFWIFNGTSWEVVQHYSIINTYNWSPSTSGSYKIWVDVKDANSNKDVDSHKEILYTIESSKPVILSSITTDKSSPQYEGNSIKVIANATGGDSLRYRFWVFNGAAWKVVQHYSTQNTFKWTPFITGSYKIWVDVKDVNSNKDVDSYKEIEYTINKSPSSESTNINHGNIINLGITAKQDEWIYYYNQANYGRLSKIKEDGSSVMKLSNDIPFYINVVDEWVYYSNVSDNLSIYKVKTDGTERTKLNSDISEFINVVDGWIFYQNNSDDYKLYRMRLDGTEKTKINDERSLYINVVGDWIYYCNYSNIGEICRVKKDGTEKTIINNETSQSIIVQDNWIYYLNKNQYDLIYRIDIDGLNKSKLCSYGVFSFNVSGDWIYYPGRGSGGKPFKQKIDGTERIQLDSDSTTTFLNLIDDDMYLLDEKNFNFYRIKKDGSEKNIFGLDTVVSSIGKVRSVAIQGNSYEFPETIIATMSDGSSLYVPVSWNTIPIDTSISGVIYNVEGSVQGYDEKVYMTVTVVDKTNTNGNSVNSGLVAEKNEWIYFKENSDGKLYKMKNDDSEKTKLTDDIVSNIHVSGEWVYYLSDISLKEPRLFKIKNDGTGRTQLSNNKIDEFNMIDDLIFYINDNDNSSLYRIDKYGNNEMKLNNDDSFDINVTNNWIYYVNNQDNGSIYKIRHDGAQRTKVLNIVAAQINVYNDYVYYINNSDDDKIYRVKTDGSNNEKIGDEEARFFNVNDDWIYYCHGKDGYKLYRIKTDGTQSSKVTEDKVYYAGQGEINFLDNFIYYKNALDSHKIYRIRPDGKERQVFGSVVTISAIDDIYVNINTNEEYTLPETVITQMSEGLDNQYEVTWDQPNEISDKAGVYTFQGSVDGYGEKVKLVLTVEDLIPGEIIYGNTPGNLSNEALAVKQGDWIYYSYSDDYFTNLNKVKTDGTGEVNLTTGSSISGINVVGAWIYYLEHLSLYKIRTDGTSKSKVIDDYVGEINIVDDWIYYANLGSGGLYRMKMDGTQQEKISSDIPQGMIVQNGWIYYYRHHVRHRMRVDGTEKSSSNIYNSRHFNVVGDYIYYEYYGKLYRSKVDGTENTIIQESDHVGNLNVSGEWIYYSSYGRIYKINLDGTSKILVSDDGAGELNIVGEWIYYTDSQDNTYKIKIDGTGRKKLN